MFAVRRRVVALTLLVLVACVAPLTATVEPVRPRPPLSFQLLDAGFIGLVRIDSVTSEERGNRLVHVPVGAQTVVESARGALTQVELNAWRVDDLGPVWFDGAYVIVVHDEASGVQRLDADDVRFPVGLNAARAAWRTVVQGVMLAEALDASPPPEVWTEWITELLKRPCLRDDGLYEIRAALKGHDDGLPLQRMDLFAVRPALQAMLQASDVAPEHALRAAELAYLLGQDVSAWVLDGFGAWLDTPHVAMPPVESLDWLDQRSLTAVQRSLVARLRAAAGRGDVDAARADADELLHELGWLPPGLSPVEAALAAVADVPDHEWLLRLDDERVTRDDLVAERPDGSAQSLAEVASALALRHFALIEFERHADRDPEAAWLLEVTRDPEAAVENEAVATVAWGGVLSRLIWPRYGGRTAYYSFGGSIALDAYTDLLREQVERGRLAVRPELAPLFWAELADTEGGHLAEPLPDDDVDSLFPPFWRRLSGGGPLAEDAAGR